jgi:serine beta-lactamase-like protein LACTB
MLAVKQKKPLPKIAETTLVKVNDPELHGLFKHHRKLDESETLEIYKRDGRVYLLSGNGNFRLELRAQGDDLIADDRLTYGQRFTWKDKKLFRGKDEFKPDGIALPIAPPPQKWLGLIGEYGWDHNTMYIFEQEGRLWTLIEWFFLYPLTEKSENVFEFPAYGLYPGEKLIFTRDKKGKATEVEAASVVFPRRKLDGEDGETFKIKPVRPLAEIRKEALAAKPPEEKGDFRKPELVDLATLDGSIKFDIRYATNNNFLSTPLYTSAKAYMQKPAASALVSVHQDLKQVGYGLLIYDAYRPWSVTKMFWEATPEKLRIFVADPSKGSRHNRGCAVDLTLYDLKSGKPVDMVGGYDEMSDRSYPAYMGGTSRQRYHREMLRQAMEAHGFSVYEAEWWHFDYKDWKQYGILNMTFEELEKK